jgi:hypothetical protein
MGHSGSRAALIYQHSFHDCEEASVEAGLLCQLTVSSRD